MLKDPDVATEVGSKSIRGVWKGKNEAKRSVTVRALKAMRNRVLTENMKQEGNMFLFFKAPAWYMERTGQEVVNITTRLPGLVAVQ